MATMEVCFDGMNADARHLIQDPLFQDPVMSELDSFAHYNSYNDYNDSTFALQDCFPAIQEIMTPVAGLPIVEPFSFVSEHHCHPYHPHHQDQVQDHHHHHHHRHQEEQQHQHQQHQQYQHQQQQVLHIPFYHNERHYVSMSGQENSSNASPELEIPNTLPRTTLTWVPTPTPTLQSPVPSPPFKHGQANDDKYSPSNGNSSSQPKLRKNAAQPKRKPTEKKSTSPSSPNVPMAAKTSKKKRPQKSLEGSKKSSMTSRMKSKEWLRNIESISKQLEAQYDNLKAEHARLLQETLRLKSDLICHAKCRDARLDAWINNEARKFVSASGRAYGDSQHSPTDWGMPSENHFGSMPGGAEEPWCVETV
ncbi:hypothetical protein E4U54_001071 [Claviceps lovelessii]|nr:hypothetical protein E4U54_001071 [Claviceps lovelessii]